MFALDCATFQADTRKINPARWTDRAGDTGPFILPLTASHLATGLTVKKGRKEKKIELRRKERGEGTQATHTAIPHVYL